MEENDAKSSTKENNTTFVAGDALENG